MTVPITGLTTPYGVAVSASAAVTATSYTDGVTTQSAVVRRPAGGTQAALSFGSLGSPFGVALDAAGNTYVTDLSANVVLKQPAGGGSPTTLGFTGLLNPAGVAVDASGAVYVADSGNARVEKLSGGVQSTLDFTGLSSPYGIAVDDQGSVYVTDADDDDVVKLTSGGSQSTLGFSGLSSPDGIAVDDAHNVYVADADHNRVVELPSGGAQLTLAFTGLDAPAGVAIGPDGSVVVADSDNDRIVELPADTPYAPFLSWTALVDQQYIDVVGRAPSSSELSSWTAKLQGGTATPGDVVAALRTSSENVTNVDPVTRLYRAYFLRIPDRGGLTYWIAQRRSGQSLDKISASFAGSSEFTSRYGSLTNKQFVNLVYQNVLGRSGDAGGVKFWTAQLDQHKRTRGQVMTGFSESHEYVNAQGSEVNASVLSIFLLHRGPTTSEFSSAVTALDGSTTLATYANQILDGAEYGARIR
ncbi:MAG: DUF4214 domain-containing protein [Acidimicrobiia bacterium]|nr:DUF4214 domain-containing protein [Acidimicrobiia bacterium]